MLAELACGRFKVMLNLHFCLAKNNFHALRRFPTFFLFSSLTQIGLRYTDARVEGFRHLYRCPLWYYSN